MAVGVAFPLLLARAGDAFAATTRSYGENTPLHLDQGKPAETAASSGGSLVRTIVGLAIVIAVIYGLYWILKQVKASREERASGSGLETLATLPLGPSRSLHMVKSGREVVLIGVAEHGVTPIKTWTEDEAKDAGFLDEFGEVPAVAGTTTTANAGSKPRSKRQGFPTFAEFVEELRRKTVRT
jgi:flagellar protein FliO/FliZ